MKLTGHLVGVSESYLSKKARLVLEVNEMGKAKECLSLRDLNLDIELKRHRKKRSLNANSYYFVLVTKIAEVLHSSIPEIHNRMLRRYGQIQLLDGQAMYLSLKDTEAVRKAVDNAEEYHMRPTAEVRLAADGTPYRTWMMLKGSHEFDSKEMATLIDGVVDEAKGLGIETLPPDELERMVSAWNR